MRNVIVLSTVLGLSALGMACGDAATNVNINANRATNTVATPMPVNTATPMAANTPAMNMPANNSAMKPTNSMTANNSAMKPAMTPAPTATKKP